MVWRLIVRYGRSDETRYLPDVQALRTAVEQLRADPRVDGYTYRRLTETQWPERCPRCGNAYDPARIHSWPCRCGFTHVTATCHRCRLVDVDPPRHEECADLPADAQGANDRLSRKRWRRAH